MIDPTPWAQLQRYAVLDTSPEQLFDRLTQLAAQACGSPIAVMSLIDEDAQRFGSHHGLAPRGELHPEVVFCAQADLGDEPLWVEDAEQDERFAAFRALSADRLRFFARVPLKTSGGFMLGALSVIDRYPRMVTRGQFDALKLLAAQTVHQLEVRRASEGLRRRTEQLERIQAISHIGGWEMDLVTKRLTWTRETYRIHGLNPSDFPLTLESALALHHPAGATAIRVALDETIAKGTPFDLQGEVNAPDGVHRWVRITGQREMVRGVPRRVLGLIQDVTERRQLESEILLIAQREQQRIGFDLHDGLGQELTGVSLLLHNVTARLPEPLTDLRQELVRLEGMVRGAVGTCRLLAHGLSPVSEERGGLLYALQTLAAQMDQLHGIKVSVTATGGTPPVDEAAADHLYRMAQEALTNAIRHGMPNELVVLLSVRDGAVTLSITDDGIGIDARPGGGGMGLRIMRYRARLIGATLSIDRRPEGGTRITCHRVSLPDSTRVGAATAK